MDVITEGKEIADISDGNWPLFQWECAMMFPGVEKIIGIRMLDDPNKCEVAFPTGIHYYRLDDVLDMFYEDEDKLEVAMCIYSYMFYTMRALGGRLNYGKPLTIDSFKIIDLAEEADFDYPSFARFLPRLTGFEHSSDVLSKPPVGKGLYKLANACYEIVRECLPDNLKGEFKERNLMREIDFVLHNYEVKKERAQFVIGTTNKLGEGTYGAVFKYSNEVALKRMYRFSTDNPLELGTSPMEYEVPIEVQRQNKPGHENVLKMSWMVRTSQRVYLAFPLMEGNLNENNLLRGMSIKERVAVCIKMARGLHALHESGFLHLDFKPFNVLYANKGKKKADVVCVADFGSNLRCEPGKTVMGTAFATRPYAAPYGLDLDKEVELSWIFDAFSLGASICEVLMAEYTLIGSDGLDIALEPKYVHRAWLNWTREQVFLYVKDWCEKTTKAAKKLVRFSTRMINDDLIHIITDLLYTGIKPRKGEQPLITIPGTIERLKEVYEHMR